MIEQHCPHSANGSGNAGHSGPNDQDARLTELVRAWDRLIAGVNFVPAGRAHVRARLAETLRALLAAMAAEPFDATVGHRLGQGLVADQIAAPRALGRTICLLGGRLITDLGITDPRAPVRLAELLGQLATGFTEALRDRALIAAENINRAERTAWRDQQSVLHQRLQHALLHDRLTDLPNRAQLTRWLTETLSAGTPEGRIGVCLVTLDRFKAINDSLGTERAEQVLTFAARRLRASAGRHGHFLAHLGGEVFAVAVTNTSGPDDMAKVADRALRSLSDPVRLDGHQIKLTACAGIVERPIVDATAEDLVRAADISAGWASTEPDAHRQGGRWALFETERHERELRRHAITAAMPQALARGEFTLEYQPLIRLADGALVGVEALARWRHADFGPVSPAQFIPPAEDTGLIVPLGLALLRQACLQAAVWRRETGRAIVMSVNLAVAQVRDPATVAAVASALRDAGWPADLLQLEITESAIIGTGDDAVETLHALARQGIRLAIDDFGTGYSSLAYLAELPVHNLKLAASFLRGIDAPTAARRSNRTILPALIALSHDLDLTVTAEGIETACQAEHLRALGCDLGQGYHLGRPMVPDAITPLLAGNGTGSSGRPDPNGLTIG